MIPYYLWETINLGPFTIQVWGMFVALGMVTALLIGVRRAKRFGIVPDQILDSALYMIIFGMISARFFHVFFYEANFYFSNPADIFKVWNGGFSSFGGLVGAMLGFVWYVKIRRLTKDKIIALLDTIGFASVFGWIVGRLGCASIHDHLGVLSDSFLAVKFPDGARLDMAIIELILLLPLALLFFVIRKKTFFAGFYIYAVGGYYFLLRFVLDFFRATDIAHADARYWGLTPAQYLSLFGVIFVLYRWRQHKRTV